MSDESPVFTPMHPAIPSRATGEPKPIVPAATGLEAALSLQVPTKPLQAPPRPVKKKRTPNARKRELKELKKMVLKKPKKVRRPQQAVKNPNRPLELKSQMHALLEGLKSLRGAEHQAFTDAVLAMQDLTKPARKNVLEALAKVYAS